MTCLETFATLRVFSATMSPQEIGAVLGCEGTLARPANPASPYRHERESHYWAWETKGLMPSTDGLVHISAVLELLEGKQEKLQRLRDLGCDIDICCYWVSSGQGGPALDRHTIACLAMLELEVWWDVYFGLAADPIHGVS